MKTLLSLFILLLVGTQLHAQQPATSPDTVFTKATETKSDTIIINPVGDQVPEFPGGSDAFNKYLADSIRYPQGGEPPPGGKIFVNFVVRKDGSITNVKVIKGAEASPYFAKEAIRVFSQMPNWTPGKINGQPVSVSMTVPLRLEYDRR
jgi:periplasmic protein TonB